MNNRKFNAWARRFQRIRERSPRAHLWVAVGLAVIAYTIALALLFSALWFAYYELSAFWDPGRKVDIRLTAYAGIYLAMVLVAFWVPIERPEGHLIRRDDHPVLDGLLRDLEAKGAPRIEKIVISHQFNASVTSVPRLGVFGGHVPWLELGMPLLFVLSKEQFKAVLAHELGHAWRGHGRVTNWLYRTSATWQQLSHVGGIFRIGIGSFASWISSVLAACVLHVVREHELEADRIAAKEGSASALVEGLALLEAGSAEWYEPYLNQFLSRAALEEKVPGDLCRGFEARLKDLPRSPTEKAIEVSFRARTSFKDTHPSLCDRAKALGQSSKSVERAGVPAAKEVFGARYDRVTQGCDESAQAALKGVWAGIRTEMQESLKRYEVLKLKGEGELDASSRLEKLELASLFGGYKLDREEVRRLLDDHPGHARSCLVYGQQLLSEGDGEGEQWLRKSFELDPSLASVAWESMASYSARFLGDAEAEDSWEKQERTAVAFAKNAARLDGFSKSEQFRSPSLGEAERLGAIRAVRSNEAVARAWLVRRSEEVEAGRGLAHLLLIEAKWKRFSIVDDRARAELADQIRQKILAGGYLSVAVRDSIDKEFAAHLDSVERGFLFDRYPGTR